jgi:hypothetical protein
MASRVRCDLCGRTPGEAADEAGGDGAAATATSDQVPLTWMTSVENGRATAYCDSCARTHLRAIESKLDSEWW